MNSRNAILLIGAPLLVAVSAGALALLQGWPTQHKLLIVGLDMHSADELVRRSMSLYLLQFERDELVRASSGLVDQLQDTDPIVRANVVRAIALANVPDNEPILRELLSDGDELVAVRAAGALLANSNDAASIARLVDALSSESMRVRGEAASALVSAGAVCAPQIELAFSSEDAQLRVMAAEVAGELRDARFVPLLSAMAAADSDDRCRRRAMWALAGFGRDAIPDLQSMVRKEDEPWREIAMSRASAAELTGLQGPTDWRTLNGLALQARLQNTPGSDGTDLQFLLTLMNVSDQPLVVARELIPPFSKQIANTLTVLSESGNEVPSASLSSRATLRPEQMADVRSYVLLQPTKILIQSMNLHLSADLPLQFQSSGGSGQHRSLVWRDYDFAHCWLVKPGGIDVVLTYADVLDYPIQSRQLPFDPVAEMGAEAWRGRVTLPKLTIDVR